MSRCRVFLSVAFATFALAFSTAAAQCPAGWTAVGPINVPITCPGGSVVVSQVWYCYKDNTDDNHCNIQISKVCNPCPGISESAAFDVILAYFASNANPLGLDNSAPPLCPAIHKWTFSRPMCTTTDGSGCVTVCNGNTGYKCTKTYTACFDNATSSWVVNYLSTATVGAGPCSGGCTTGTCP